MVQWQKSQIQIITKLEPTDPWASNYLCSKFCLGYFANRQSDGTESITQFQPCWHRKADIYSITHYNFYVNEKTASRLSEVDRISQCCFMVLTLWTLCATKLGPAHPSFRRKFWIQKLELVFYIIHVGRGNFWMNLASAVCFFFPRAFGWAPNHTAVDTERASVFSPGSPPAWPCPWTCREALWCCFPAW